MLSVLKIVDYKAKNAVTVPMNIVQNDQSGTYVFTAVNENGKMVAKKNPITIGKIYSGSAEVVKGISVLTGKMGKMVLTEKTVLTEKMGKTAFADANKTMISRSRR